MLAELKILGIDYYSVFPDLDGLGMSINNEFYEKFNEAKFWDGLEL
ncbi:hypothetical protein [Pontibacter pamirensis]|nr:hypothetical protein [Pontibacter pamirensis]